MNADKECWRLIVTPPAPAAWNMACDEVLFQLVPNAPSAAILRFYEWKPYAVSVGRSQSPQKEIELNALRRDGYDCVRRITGGRAVFHVEELTYSVVCAREHPLATGGIHATYERTSEALARGLRLAGIRAEVARVTQHLSPGSPGRSAPPCFGSVARSEIVVDGRKLVGSAQYRSSTAVLQHGSILTGTAHKRILEYLRVEEDVRQRYLRNLEIGTTCLWELGWRGTTDDLMRALADGFSAHFGVVWGSSHNLTPHEMSLIDTRVHERNSRENWNPGDADGGHG